jgi:hypothetical protein
MNAQHVLTASKAYAVAAGVAEHTASWRIFGDTKKLAALAAGGDLYTGRAEAAMQWISDNWPDGHGWPSDVPRPAAAPQPERAA